MANRLTKLAAAIVFVATTSSLATVASATPVANGLAIKNAVLPNVETVQWRRGWGGGWGYRRGWGWGGVGAGFVAGAVIGGALASPYYGYDPYYYPGPYAVPPGPVVYGAPGPAYAYPSLPLLEMQSRTACSGSSPTTREAGHTSAMMALAIPVLKDRNNCEKGRSLAALFFMPVRQRQDAWRPRR
jgi:hypothetical protein